MKNTLRLLAVALIGLFVLTGCRTGVAINNITSEPSGISRSATDDQIFSAIRKAGYSKGWQVKKIRSGLAEAKIMVRSHIAVVEIPYSSKTYSIIYKSSRNLNHNSVKGTIHANYNGWITNLNNAISYELSQL